MSRELVRNESGKERSKRGEGGGSLMKERGASFLGAAFLLGCVG